MTNYTVVAHNDAMLDRSDSWDGETEFQTLYTTEIEKAIDFAGFYESKGFDDVIFMVNGIELSETRNGDYENDENVDDIYNQISVRRAYHMEEYARRLREETVRRNLEQKAMIKKRELIQLEEFKKKYEL